MKKFLYITHLSGRRFNRIWLSAIIAAQNRGYEVHLACNMENAARPGWDDDCKSLAVYTHQIDFDRNPLGVSNIRAKKQLLDLMRIESFDIVHCNTPVGGLLGRICAHECRVPCVIYQAHGFHFWKGAPIKNWLVYYPVEYILSYYTDVLVTIAVEDFEASKTMHAKENRLVHGVGIDLTQFRIREPHDRNNELREKFSIPINSFVMLSVGELNKNKNHEIVIRAMARNKNSNDYYVICGEGKLKAYLSHLVSELGLEDHVIFAGFCNNVAEYYRMADLFVFPSLREGIPAAVMEAIACGVPVLTSDIRGIRDIVRDEQYRFNPLDKKALSDRIQTMKKNKDYSCVHNNYESIQMYRFDSVIKEYKELYLNVLTKKSR